MLKARRTQMLMGFWLVHGGRGGGVGGMRKDTKLRRVNVHLVATCAPANKTWAHPVMLYLGVSTEQQKTEDTHVQRKTLSFMTIGICISFLTLISSGTENLLTGD